MKYICILLTLIVLLSSCTSCYEQDEISIDDQRDNNGSDVNNITEEKLSEKNTDDKIYDFVNPTAFNVELDSQSEASKIFESYAPLFAPTTVTEETFDNPTEEKVFFGKKEMSLMRVAQKVYSSGKIVDVYENPNENVKYEKTQNSESFNIVVKSAQKNNASKEENYIARFEEDELSEESILKNVIEYISIFIDENEYKDYNYSFSTHMYVSSEDARGYETREGFYESSLTASINAYIIDYRKYCNNIKTGDGFFAICDEAGNIRRVCFSKNNVDWETAPFFDENELKRSIDWFVETFVSEKYPLKKYGVKGCQLECRNNEIFLALDLTLEAISENGNVIRDCVLRLSKNNQ